MSRAYTLLLFMTAMVFLGHPPALAEIIQETSIGGNAYRVSTGAGQLVSPCDDTGSRCSASYNLCNFGINYTSGLAFMLPANSDQEVCKFLRHLPSSISFSSSPVNCPNITSICT